VSREASARGMPRPLGAFGICRWSFGDGHRSHGGLAGPNWSLRWPPLLCSALRVLANVVHVEHVELLIGLGRKHHIHQVGTKRTPKRTPRVLFQPSDHLVMGRRSRKTRAQGRCCASALLKIRGFAQPLAAAQRTSHRCCRCRHSVSACVSSLACRGC
jgi:hypothetical protein